MGRFFVKVSGGGEEVFADEGILGEGVGDSEGGGVIGGDKLGDFGLLAGGGHEADFAAIVAEEDVVDRFLLVDGLGDGGGVSGGVVTISGESSEFMVLAKLAGDDLGDRGEVLADGILGGGDEGGVTGGDGGEGVAGFAVFGEVVKDIEGGDTSGARGADEAAAAEGDV